MLSLRYRHTDPAVPPSFLCESPSMKSTWSHTGVLALLGWLTTSLLAAAEPTRLEIQPAFLKLTGAGDLQRVLVTAVDEQGNRWDVTEQTRLAVEDEAIAGVDPGGFVVPRADGRTRLEAQLGALQASIEVEAVEAGRTLPVSFVHEVVSVLTRYGCNAGACHGKQAGQNGFRLSLRGFAPEQDHAWLVREYQGRRISRIAPNESVLIRKPRGDSPHGGGQLFSRGSRVEHVLLNWIAAGTPGVQADEPKLSRLEVLPGQRTLRPFDTQQLIARAHFSDGSVRDVTWLTQFYAADPAVIEVSPEGRMLCLRPGETTVRAHFEDLVETITITIPYEHAQPAPLVRGNGAIDRHVAAKLAALRIPPSPGCDDATFLRRVYLDLTGTLPTADEVRAFLADTRENRRELVVDSLLARPEFVDYWTLFLADLLQNRKERDHDVRGVKGVRAFHAWIRRQVAAERGWDQIARDVLTSAGSSFEHPQVGYYVVTVGEKRPTETSEVMDSVAQSFLGTRIGCAKCHNHPLEKYTQDDYYHFAAFFTRLGLDRHKPEEGPTVLQVASPERMQLARRIEQIEKKIQELEGKIALVNPSNADAEQREKSLQELDSQRQQLEKARQDLANFVEKPVQVRQPRTGAMLPPRPLDRQTLELDPQADPRQALVDWMVDPANEYFSGAMVNRLWKHFLGEGLVEPVDDLRPSNPPSNGPLWKELNREFVSSGYRLKHVMRLIVLSQTYQASSATLPANASERRFYSHFYARRLPAEVLHDAVSQVTGVPESFAGYPLGMKAIQLPDPGVDSYFLSLFGRPVRTTACACERLGDVTLPQLLHLQNGDWIEPKLRVPQGRLNTLLKELPDNNAAIEELFLTILSRLPNESEREQTLRHVESTPDRQAAFVDLFWALLNTKEFAFQH